MERGQRPGRGWWQGCLGFEKNNGRERGARTRGCCHNDRSSLVERRVSHLKTPRERNHDTPFYACCYFHGNFISFSIIMDLIPARLQGSHRAMPFRRHIQPRQVLLFLRKRDIKARDAGQDLANLEVRASGAGGHLTQFWKSQSSLIASGHALQTIAKSSQQWSELLVFGTGSRYRLQEWPGQPGQIETVTQFFQNMEHLLQQL